VMAGMYGMACMGWRVWTGSRPEGGGDRRQESGHRERTIDKGPFRLDLSLHRKNLLPTHAVPPSSFHTSAFVQICTYD
jgi:hypothetical protein